MRIVERLKNAHFAKSVALVASGTMAAQIINVITTPIITRLYSSDVYGVLSVYNSTVSILVIGSSLAFQKAIPIVDSDHNAKTMLENCIGINCLYSLTVFFACLIFGKHLFVKVGIGELYNTRWIIPLGVFFVGVYEIFLQWIYRKRTYSLIPKTRLVQAFAGCGVKLIGGYLFGSPFILLMGAIINQGAGLFTLYKKVREDVHEDKRIESLKNHFAILFRYKKFMSFSLPADFFSTFAGHIPVLMLSSFFGTAISGYYGLANSIINLPVGLVIVSISRVFYAEAAKIGKNNPKEIKRLCVKISKIIFAIIIIPALITIFWGPQLFSFVFGKEWYEAGYFARLMMGMVVSYCIVLPVGRIYEILEKQNYDFVINLFRVLAIILTVFMIQHLGLNSHFAVFIIATINMIAYLAMYIGVMICLKNQEIKCELIEVDK